MKIPRWLRWRSNAELDEEIETHIELETRANLDRGLSPAAARLAARRRFGNAALVKERARETDPLFRVQAFVADVRHTLRGIARAPGFAIASVLTLAVAIGATTAIFSVVDGVLIRPLPFPDADRVVRITLRTHPQAVVVRAVKMPFAELGFWHFVRNNRTFSRVGGVDVFAGTNGLDEWALTGQGAPYPLTVARMTASAFEILGVPPQRGRFPTAAEDLPGGPRLVLLSDSLWRSVFASDPAIVGRAVLINGRPWEVIGVMPERFDFPRAGIDAWIPFELNPAATNQNPPTIDAIARLAPGETIESATADAERLIAGFAEIGYSPSWTRDVLTGEADVRTLKEDVVGDVRRPLLVLFGTTGFLLLIACSNVANLFQVRAESRTVEAAVRIALGSGRRRLIQYLLTEGAVLGLLGGAVGTVLAYGGLRVLAAMAPASIPRVNEIGINGTVLAFTAALSLSAGLLFAALPALRTGSPRVLRSLHGARGTVSRERQWTRRGLVVAQVALALALFVGSVLMVRSFAALRAIDPGFDASSVLTFRVSPGATRHPDGEATARFYDALLEDIRALPDVTAAGAASFIPMTGGIGGLGGPFLGAQIEDFPLAEGAALPTFVFRRATPGYFEAMGIPIIEGRTFGPDDHNRRLGTLIISKSIKDKYWPGTSALGKRLAIVGPPATIVGVVGDVHDSRLNTPAEPVVYKPLLDARGGNSRAMTITVRTRTEPLDLFPAVGRVIESLDPDLPVSDIQSLQSIVGDSISRTSFTMTILTMAAGIALLLGAIGIYGVMAYGVVQRTGEIGIRQALGADRTSVCRLFVREGMMMGGVGVVLGLAAAVGVGQVLTSLLYGVTPYDVGTLVGGALVFLGVAALASAIPVARAVRISPATALRGE